MNKHTPGEWELRHERHLGKTTHVVKIGTASVYFNRGIGQTEEMAVANGKLIASAPELLEALEECVTSDGAACFSDMKSNPQRMQSRLHAISDIARAAIAKARGL